MYYQHTDTRYHPGPYQQDIDNGRMLLRHHAACFCDSERRQASGSSSRNFNVFHNPVHDRHAQQQDSAVLPRVPSNHHGGTSMPESRRTSYRHDVMQQTNDVGLLTVMSPPSPYDCKPPYSYISLIAMAIESSPDRRSVCVYFTSQFLYSVVCCTPYTKIQKCIL